MRIKISVLIFFILICSFETLYSKSPSGLKRYALVIGNAKYQNSPLKNPGNDAGDMKKVLEEKGFEVQLLINSSFRKMKSAVRTFGKKLYSGGIGLFYYAGHGVQIKGRNYLIPININVESEEDVEFGALDADYVLSTMDGAANSMNIIILDACRDNPFARSFRSFSRGLGKMEAPRGSIIVYSTSPGCVAKDGDGRNGTFTKHLLELIRNSSLEIAKLLKNLRKAVVEETAGFQMPWESSSLMEDFYFTPEKKIVQSKGYLSISIIPYAEVFIDDISYGEVPPVKKIRLSSGKHNLILKYRNKIERRIVVIKMDQTTVFTFNFK